MSTVMKVKTKKLPKHGGNIVRLPGLIARIKILKNPWYTKKQWTFARPVDWDSVHGYPQYIAGLRPAQIQACTNLAQASIAAAGYNREARRAAFREVLSGKSYGGKAKKPRGKTATVEELVAIMRGAVR
jgi:hypothetical protein